MTKVYTTGLGVARCGYVLMGLKVCWLPAGHEGAHNYNLPSGGRA